MDDSRSILKFIKFVLLVIIVAMSIYWCILLLIVAVMLSGHRSDPASGAESSAHTSIILIFLAFMTVLGIGLAILVFLIYWVTYQLKEFDQSQQRITRGISGQAHSDWDTPKPLIAFNSHFQRYTNLESLVPLLCDHHVLQTSELEVLLDYHRRFDKISYLLTILDKKGRNGINGVIHCLKKDEMHLGHQDLASTLEEHYCYGVGDLERGWSPQPF